MSSSFIIPVKEALLCIEETKRKEEAKEKEWKALHYANINNLLKSGTGFPYKYALPTHNDATKLRTYLSEEVPEYTVMFNWGDTQRGREYWLIIDLPNPVQNIKF